MYELPNFVNNCFSMHLDSITILNFKSFEQATLSFSPKINCFVGNNGAGKTNMLDAIHYLCLCKSYFNPVDSQNIRHNQEFSVIQGDFRQENRTDELFCSIHRNKNKVFKRNKKEYERLAQHIGLFPTVMISPEDSAIIMEGSEERRKFLNSVIAQFDKAYLDDIISYNKLLSQRNKLLKDIRGMKPDDRDMLGVYNEQMIPYAERIFDKRAAYTLKMIPIFNRYYKLIAPDNEVVDLIYQSQLEGHAYADLLSASYEKDLAMQYTTYGIHKDDLLLKLNGHAMKKTGSQGQQKTLLVALKLAQFDFIREMNGVAPLLLLDDVFDKFDESRVSQIIRLVSDDHFGQIFITHTDKHKIQTILHEMNTDYRLFRIQNGQVHQEN
jgi:DNA replication and repair protein RecF